MLAPQMQQPAAAMQDQVSIRRRLEQLERKLRGLAGRVIADYRMIESGDRVMACLSGGKDSYAMLDLLRALQRKAPVQFDLFAVNLNQKHPGFPEHVLPAYLTKIGIEHYIIEEDTYSITKANTPEGKTLCRICSRLRRGILYSVAAKYGASKIALGHHLDDAVETLFLNMFFGGRMKSMPPKLQSDDRAHTVIRPLYYAREVDIAEFSRLRQHPIIPCNLCGSQENLQRQQLKRMLANWDAEQPGRVESIAKSMRTVVPSHLADSSLHDFGGCIPE